MDITDGNLGYTFLFDASQGEASIDKLIENLKALGLSAEEAGKVADELASKMTDALNEIAESADGAEDAVGKIRDKSEELRDSAEDMADSIEGMKAEFLADSLDAVGDAIEEDASMFDKLSDSAKGVNGALDISTIAMKSLVSVTGKGTTAVKALTTAQKALNAVMAKNPIGAVIALVAAAAAGIVALANKAKKAAEELKKMNENVAKTAAKHVEQIENLSDAWGKLGNDLKAKQKFVDDNAEAFKQLGVNVKSVEEAENLLIQNKDAFVKAQIEKAKAVAAGAMAQEIMAKKLEAELKKETTTEKRKVVDRGEINEITGEYDSSAVTWVTTNEYKKLEEEIKEYDEKLEKLYGIAADSEKNAVKTLEESGIKSWKEYEDGTVGAIQQAIADKRNALKDVKSAEDYNAIVSEISQLESQLEKITGKNGKLDPIKVKKDIDNYLSELKEANERAEDLALANLDNTAANREKKIRTDYGRQIADAEAKALSASTPQLAEAYRKQAEELNKAMKIAVKAVYDEEAKKQKEVFDEMLDYYEEYTHSKKKIDEQYQKDLNAATLAYLTASTNEEKKIYADLIKDIGKGRAKNQFDLDMAKVDTTAYATVEEKMDAINKAYATYIDNLVKAGASVAEINAAMREQNELTGKTATLSAQLKDIEATKLSAAESGDVDLVKRLNEEIRKLKKQLDDIEKTSNKKTLGTMFKEWAHELKASDLINAGGQLGDVIANIGDAAESKAVAGFGQALSFAGDIGAKIASGDYLGAALSIITEIGNAIAEDIAKVKAFEKANEQAAQTANQINIDNLLGGEDGIFGENTVRQLANYLEALDKARKAISDIGVNSSKSFKVLDRSAFANFFGGSDKFSTLGEFARKNGMELLDAYGNINAQVLDLFKNTYEDLTEADKQWIDNAIAYTDQYAEAMEGLASYLQSIFGSTVDAIVDQIFEGSVDIHAITSELGKTMAKDLMQSLIMAAYFDDLEEKFKKILQDEGGMTESAMMQIYALWSERMAMFNDQLPMWEELRDKWAQTLDFDTEAASIGAGTALSSASQESIDLMNGQLNAMRTVQGRIDGTINNILLEMRGFRGDVNANHGETLQQLQQINTNTSERGLGRALGAYFG